jgi:hypothetical protein
MMRIRFLMFPLLFLDVSLELFKNRGTAIGQETQKSNDGNVACQNKDHPIGGRPT